MFEADGALITAIQLTMDPCGYWFSNPSASSDIEFDKAIQNIAKPLYYLMIRQGSKDPLGGASIDNQ